jgi:hypothetical protein
MNSIIENNEDKKKRKNDLSEAMMQFGMHVSNSQAYIDANRLESEINIKIAEVHDAANRLTEKLRTYLESLTNQMPTGLGEFSVINHMPGGVFLCNDVSITVSKNTSWGKVVQLRYNPSEKMMIHNNVNYVDLSFYVGLTEAKKHYWIVQIRNQTILKAFVVEQIETKFLTVLVDNKIAQIEELITRFLDAIQSSIS